MNIFASDRDPRIAAHNLDDKRVIKMIAESCQLLATAIHITTGETTPIRPTHINHPVNIWARATRSNYRWLFCHACALMHEKRQRWPGNKPHVYEQYISYFRRYAKTMPIGDLQPFANCAANKKLGIDYHHINNPVIAYRLYLADRWETDKRPPRWYGVEK